MSPAIQQRLHSLRPASLQGERLAFVAIAGEPDERLCYQLFNPSTATSVEVSEISDAGSVPELLVRNRLDTALFLMDGQELIGAKQNRILNTDVLIAAGRSIKIPVSCVEAHRWSYSSAIFAPGKSASHRIRSRKHSRVHASLKSQRRHDADQQQVWQEVDASLSAAAAQSDTAALSDAYKVRETDLQALRTSLRIPDEAIGLAAFSGDQLLSVDVFDRSATLKAFWDSLVDAVAIDHLTNPGDAPGRSEDYCGQLTRIFAELAGRSWEPFPSVAAGMDWRLESEAHTASALVADHQSGATVVHLQIFPRIGDDNHSRTFRRPRRSLPRPEMPASDQGG